MHGEEGQRSRVRPWLNVRDDVAYMLPMGVFLLFTFIGGRWPATYPITYVAKAVIVTVLLVLLWRYFTSIRWHYWWLGLVLGVLTIYQWVGMQLFLERNFELFAPPSPDKLFIPFAEISPPWLAWTFVVIRVVSAALLVPVMEELFWRDFLWRQIVAPNDFKLAKVGEWDWKALVAVSLVFGTVHGGWWLTSIIWGFMIGGLLALTRSLGACIVMHATTNLLLHVYILREHFAGRNAWSFA